MKPNTVFLIVDLIWLFVIFTGITVAHFAVKAMSTGEYYISMILWYGIARYLLINDRDEI